MLECFIIDFNRSFGYEMIGNLKCRGLILRALVALLFHMSFCFSLNIEGIALLRFKDRVISDPYDALGSWKYEDGNSTPCSWSGVRCSTGGDVVALELRDLCLEGVLGPELGQLTYLKSLVLRNNSFSGIIPEQIGELMELEVLDLGYNNFTGSLPQDIGSIPSLSILLLDHNKHFSNANAKLAWLSCNKLWKVLHQGDTGLRRILKGIQALNRAESESSKNRGKTSSVSSSSVTLAHSQSPLSSISSPPSTSPFFPLESPSPSPPPAPAAPTRENAPTVIEPVSNAAPSLEGSKNSNKNLVLILVSVIGSTLLIVLVLSIVFCRKSKVVSVRPWATGLSGQLQKAFITGVPRLQRSELKMACEDFSNIIGALCDGTVYKGTLSSGVEIAVTSTAAKSAKDWSKSSETQFRNKIDTLSKVNHKNFVNLIGYCEDENPFTRMMVFEYAPNGTLFEHLHIKESEHLDWRTRLRIAMGIACCLEYMHQLSPPIAHWNLQSSSIYLTEDYAAKISDFSLWNEVIAAKVGSATMKLLETPSTDTDSNLYSFGMILLEMITSKFPPFSAHEALDHFKKGMPLREIVDPTLHFFKEEEIEKLAELVKHCLNPIPEERPKMREIVARLKDITSLEPDAATPKSSPLWWAELEILATEI